jgi:hypothetical protein
MKRILIGAAVLTVVAGWTAVASATSCVSSVTNKKIEFIDVTNLGGNQFTLTFENWDIVTSSGNDCGLALQLDVNTIASVDDVTWFETGTTNVVTDLGSGWVGNATIAAAAEGLAPSGVDDDWFGFLNTNGGSAPAGVADLQITVTLLGGQGAGDLINSIDKQGGKKIVFTDQADGAGNPQNVDRGFASLRGGAIVGPGGQTKCQRAIAKEASKFVKAKTKTLQKCEEAKVKDKHTDPCPNPGGAVGTAGRKAADKIAKAISKLHAGIDKQCGGVDKVCGGNTSKEVGGALAGRPEICPDFEGNGCTNAIDLLECTGIADCIECIGEAAVDEAIALYYADLEDADPVAQAALNKCQQTIGKSVSKYLLAKEKALQKCWDARYNKKHTVACPDINASPITAKDAVKAGEKIAKAESKKIAKICKACGGADKLCDGFVTPVNPGTPTLGGSGGSGPDADFTADDILVGAGPFACPNVTVPAGPSRAAVPCGGTIATLADLIFCLDCVTEYKVDCVDPNRIDEAFISYPAECN